MAIAGTVLIGLGLFFMAVTAIGLIRLPDFYTRTHAVSKTDTLGIGLVLVGLALHEGATLVSLKMVLGLLFIFIANPVAAHVLTRLGAASRHHAVDAPKRVAGAIAMVWQLEFALYGLLVLTSVIALWVRDLLAAVASLTVYSFIAATLMALMGAVDVALTEIALGAGVTGVLLIGGISLMRRRSSD